jgi:hypothetical protein
MLVFKEMILFKEIPGGKFMSRHHRESIIREIDRELNIMLEQNTDGSELYGKILHQKIDRLNKEKLWILSVLLKEPFEMA